jgi:hypothetical protein
LASLAAFPSCRLAENADTATPDPYFHRRTVRALQERVRFQESVGVLGAFAILGSDDMVVPKQVQSIAGGHDPLSAYGIKEPDRTEPGVALLPKLILRYFWIDGDLAFVLRLGSRLPPSTRLNRQLCALIYLIVGSNSFNQR